MQAMPETHHLVTFRKKKLTLATCIYAATQATGATNLEKSLKTNICRDHTSVACHGIEWATKSDCQNNAENRGLSENVACVALVACKKNNFLNENFEERAAIMEFDGGMTQQEAEAAAWEDLVKGNGYD